MDALGDFLSKKLERENSDEELLDQCREKWPAAIDRLFSRLDGWLFPYKEASQMTTQRVANPSNDTFGTTKAFEITVGKDKILITPDGNPRMGSIGRVSVVGPRGNNAGFIQPEWDSWIISREKKERNLRIETALENMELKKLDTELNEESFRNLVIELLR